MPAYAWPMRIALVAPPMLPVPPRAYAGTERVIEVLARELHRRGHAVTLFASGDSDVECELVPTVERALWERSDGVDMLDPYIQVTETKVWREAERFDVIHSHLEGWGFAFARHCPTPVVTTMHGRLDLPGVSDLLTEFSDIPLIAISNNQRRWFPDVNWVATIHHGLPLEAIAHSDRPGSYLALVGRISHEKGVAEAVELARRTGLKLRVAAKMRLPDEKQLYRDVLEPAIKEGIAEYLGEVGQAERDALYAGALATLMLGAWPEPFGLVAIESLAAGTPVIARKAGALPEIVEHGVDGFLVDDLGEAAFALERVRDLDRHRIRQRVLTRFSPERMVEAHERAYRRVIEEAHARRTPRQPARTAPLVISGEAAAGGMFARPSRSGIDQQVRGETVAAARPLGAADRRDAGIRIGNGDGVAARTFDRHGLPAGGLDDVPLRSGEVRGSGDARASRLGLRTDPPLARPAPSGLDGGIDAAVPSPFSVEADAVQDRDDCRGVRP